MLKKTVTFKNLDGVEVTEDFYFNLTKAELLKYRMIKGEGYEALINKVVSSGDGQGIIDVFDEFLRTAYGERRPDGKFVKSVEAYDAFMATEAYSQIFWELVTDANAGAAFINAIIPDNLAEEVAKLQDNPETPQDVVTKNVFEQPTEMSDEEMLKALGADEPEVELTNGLTDDQIKVLKPSELRGQPREVLMRAMKLKNQK